LPQHPNRKKKARYNGRKHDKKSAHFGPGGFVFTGLCIKTNSRFEEDHFIGLVNDIMVRRPHVKISGMIRKAILCYTAKLSSLLQKKNN